MKEKLLRQTKQRSLILEELKKSKTHPTAEELFLHIKEKMPSISFATVYRNLNFLKNKGEILELSLGKYSSRYDGDISMHHHFFCLGCNRIFDIYFSSNDRLTRHIEEKLNFKVKYQRRDFYGYCKDCKGKTRDKT